MRLHLCLTVLAGAVWASVGVACATQVEGFELRQASKTVGEQKVIVTARALRCENISTHVVLVSVAPDWKVVVYNPTTKRTHSKAYKDFSGYLQNQMVFFTGSSYADKPLIAAGSGTFKGFTSHSYTEPNNYRATVMPRYYKKMVVGGEPVEMIYTELTLPGISKQAESVLERFYGLAQKGGVPVVFGFTSVAKEKKVVLSTSAINKVVVDDAVFKIPAGLTLTKNVEEVFLDGKSDDGSELIDLFGSKATGLKDGARPKSGK